MSIDIPPQPAAIHAAAPEPATPSTGTAEAAPGTKVIGRARMLEDGTIAMELRMEDPKSGAVGHSYPKFAPGSPRYKEILDHLGPFKPGEVKPVMNDWP
jgi:hypothetical protein